MGRPEGCLCAVPKTENRVVEASASAGRVRSVRSFEKKWMNGSVLRYHFLAAYANGADWEDFKAFVREGFATWKAQGLGLTFEETSDLNLAQIRIGFLQGDGSWSYLGRDVLTIERPGRTMNFGWNLRGDPDTVIHEIGHTLGLQHEHQNPNAGIVWDDEAAYALFAGAPNFWDRATVDFNILRKIDSDKVDGGNWDANSVMHYSLPGRIISEPAQYRLTGINPEPGLSPEDKKWISIFYPPLNEPPVDPTDPTDPGPTEPVALEPLLHETLWLRDVAEGGQVNLEVRPPRTAMYTFQTLGDTDTVMVLFKKGALDEQIAAVDDSGTSNNAKIKVLLEEQQQYVLRIRLVWAGESTKLGVVYW